jgi:hypothetical protein
MPSRRTTTGPLRPVPHNCSGTYRRQLQLHNDRLLIQSTFYRIRCIRAIRDHQGCVSERLRGPRSNPICQSTCQSSTHNRSRYNSLFPRVPRPIAGHLIRNASCRAHLNGVPSQIQMVEPAHSPCFLESNLRWNGVEEFGMDQVLYMCRLVSICPTSGC